MLLFLVDPEPDVTDTLSVNWFTDQVGLLPLTQIPDEGHLHVEGWFNWDLFRQQTKPSKHGTLKQ